MTKAQLEEAVRTLAQILAHERCGADVDYPVFSGINDCDTCSREGDDCTQCWVDMVYEHVKRGGTKHSNDQEEHKHA